MNPSLLNDVEVDVCLGTQADGTGTQSGTILDMQGYEGVMFVATFADVDDTAVLTLQAQQDGANAAGNMSTLSGNSTFTADATSGDNKALVLDVYRPRERYVRAQVVIATANATTASVTAVRYGAAKKPVTQPATVVDSDTLVEPAEA
ncbi:MAG: hypothetical protein HQL70_09700 [Magnetococcales bacterium]|nr:hypothetical protein [Magnetococcales bacterium]